MMIKELIKPKLKASSSEEVIKTLGELLLNSGYVADTYINAVLQRESTLPTGLQVGRLNVAIPHTDAVHVKESTVSLATLDKPVKFRLMEDPTKEVDVSIVFLLAVREPKAQVELLRRLMSIFQNEDLLAQIENTEDSEAIFNMLTPVLA